MFGIDEKETYAEQPPLCSFLGPRDSANLPFFADFQNYVIFSYSLHD